MEVTMISRGVEISITGGVAETEDGLTIVTESLLHRQFMPTPLTLVTHNMHHTVL